MTKVYLCEAPDDYYPCQKPAVDTVDGWYLCGDHIQDWEDCHEDERRDR